MTEFRPSRFQILPPVIKNLLIINGLVFLAQNTLNGPSVGFSIDDTFALHAWQSGLFKPWQLLTHLFMHGGLTHIFFNMLALWMFGAVLENVWGSKRFLTFYLICGLGAALIHLLFLNWELAPVFKEYSLIYQQHMSGSEYEAETLINYISRHHVEVESSSPLIRNSSDLISVLQAHPRDPDLLANVFNLVTSDYNHSINGSTVGASGAVFGILAAFGYLFPNTYLYVYMLVPVKAKWFVLFYGALELYEGIRNSAGDNVAHWAHIGGALVGLLIVMTWNKTNKRTLY